MSCKMDGEGMSDATAEPLADYDSDATQLCAGEDAPAIQVRQTFLTQCSACLPRI